MTTNTKHIESIGHLCQTFQRSYAVVARTLQEIGAEPVVTINGIPHYGEQEIERLGERLRQGKQERRP
jgi:hypothetical protein